MSTSTPAPGSDAAIAAGCTCPVVDNHYGQGLYTELNGTKVFVMNMTCPLHGQEANQELKRRFS